MPYCSSSCLGNGLGNAANPTDDVGGATWMGMTFLSFGMILAAIPGMASADGDGVSARNAPTANAQNGSGSYTVFNKPRVGGGADDRIESDLVKRIEQTPAGATIQGSMFTWTQEPVADALKDAQSRGVHVRLAIDSEGAGDWNSNPDNKAQKVLQGADLDKLVYCKDSDGDSSACVSIRKNSINHNKMFMFSRTGDMNKAVWIASYNLTASQRLLFNNAVVLYGRSGLYHEFEGHMRHLLAQDKNNDYYHSDVGTYHSDDNKVSIYMSPRPDSDGGTEGEASTDTVVEHLSKIRSSEKGCEIDVTQAQFTGPRRAVADELVRIGKLGCQVRVVYGDGLTQYTYDILHGEPNIKMRGYYDGRDSDNPISIHSKYLRIKANYDGHHRDMVLTGSHNLTGPALRKHDEILAAIQQPAVGRQYGANFRLLWRRATCKNVPDDAVCHHDG